MNNPAPGCNPDSCGHLPAPADHVSNLYRKSEAVAIVANLSTKHTSERKQLVEKIVDAGYVPSKSALQKLLRRYEKGEIILDDDWGERGRCVQK